MAVLGAFLACSLITTWQLARLPLGTAGTGLEALGLIACGYLAFRLWLTQQSLILDDTGFELRWAGKTRRVEFSQIRGLHFDHVSHDLIVATSGENLRIARTLQGHRVIRKRIQESIVQESACSADGALMLKPRILPRIAAVLALMVMVMCLSAVWFLNPSLGMLNLLGLAFPTYVLFDRCVLARYSFTSEGVEAGGIGKPRFYARGELVGCRINKGVLSSTLRLDFGSAQLEVNEYLLGQSLVEISEFLEQNWGVQVNPARQASGLYPGVESNLS